MQISIRQATKDDAALLAELNLAVHDLHVAAEPDRYKVLNAQDPELIASFANHLDNALAYIFIAEADGLAVGYILMVHQQTEENVFVLPQNRLHIDQMSVNASHRGKGIGHHLMEKTKELGKRLGVDYISLGVRAFNEEAIAFYQREGFGVLSFNMWQKLKD